MGVRQAIVRGFLKLNIFARVPKVEKLSEKEVLENIDKQALEYSSGADYEEELEDGTVIRIYRSRER